MANVKNKEGDNVASKEGNETNAEKQAKSRARRRVLVAFNTDGVPEKAFPATYQKLESHNRIIYCRPTVEVQAKLNLDATSGVSFDKTTGKIRVVRGSKGAKSFQFLFPDNDNKNKTTSYSLPVPSWVNLAVFAGAIGKALKAADALKDCVGIVSPDGQIYSPDALTKILETDDADNSDNTQDGDSTSETADNKAEDGN